MARSPWVYFSDLEDAPFPAQADQRPEKYFYCSTGLIVYCWFSFPLCSCERADQLITAGGWQAVRALYLPHHVLTCNPFDCAEHTRHSCLLLLTDILTSAFKQFILKSCWFRNIVYVGPDLLNHSGHSLKRKKKISVNKILWVIVFVVYTQTPFILLETPVHSCTYLISHTCGK